MNTQKQFITAFVLCLASFSQVFGQELKATRMYTFDPAGSSIHVQIEIDVIAAPPPASFIITETIPDGWDFVSASPEFSMADPATCEMKWLLADQNGLSSVVICYVLLMPVSASEPPPFNGTFLYLDAAEQPILRTITTLHPTPTPVPPTNTPTDTPIPPTDTSTPVPPTNTATYTPVPPTDTSTPVPPTNTATYTPVPPTDTSTPVPPTNTVTYTPVPPTPVPPTPIPPTPVPPTPVPPTPVPPTPTPFIISKVSIAKIGEIEFSDEPRGLISADFDNDSLKDLVTTLPFSQEIVLMKTTGSLNTPIIQSTMPIGEQLETEFLAHGDFDGDGNRDLCIVSYIDETLAVLLGNGEGEFASPIVVTVPNHVITDRRQQPVVCSDTDQDGKDEIFAVIEERGQFNQIRKYHLPDNSETLTEEEIQLNGITVETIQMIDIQPLFDNTGPVMILTTLDRNPENPSSVLFCRQTSSTEFEKIEGFSLWKQDIGDYATAFQSGEANQDGITDFVILSFIRHAKLYTAFNAQSIEEVQIGDVDFSQIKAQGAILEDVAIADFDLDGLPDLIYVSRETGSEGEIFALITIVSGDELNSWEKAVSFRTSFPTTTFSWIRLESIDFNLDGLQDLAFLENTSQNLILLLNTSVPPSTPTPAIPTQNPTPTPTPTPPMISVDLQFLSENKLPVSELENLSSLSTGAVPMDNTFPNATDGEGLIVELRPGEGNLLLLNEPIATGEQMVELSVSVRCTSNQVQLGLAALSEPYDGSRGYVNPSGSEIPVDRWGRLRLLYDSPSTSIRPALQIVLPNEATEEPVTVYIDNLLVESFEASETTPITIAVDSTFDSISDISTLNPNLFLSPDENLGTVDLSQGLHGQGVQLGLLLDQLAARIVLFSDNQQTGLLEGSVMVKKESGSGGMMAIGLIDEDQSVVYFLSDSYLSTDDYRTLSIGGNFESINPAFLPVLVVQYGGPHVAGSVLIDDAGLWMIRE